MYPAYTRVARRNLVHQRASEEAKAQERQHTIVQVRHRDVYTTCVGYSVDQCLLEIAADPIGTLNVDYATSCSSANTNLEPSDCNDNVPSQDSEVLQNLVGQSTISDSTTNISQDITLQEWPNIVLLPLPHRPKTTVGPKMDYLSYEAECDLYADILFCPFAQNLFANSVRLDLYFEHIHPMWPISRRAETLDQHRKGLMPKVLKSIMIALATYYLPDHVNPSMSNIDPVKTSSLYALEYDIWSKHSQSNDYTLDQVKAAFLHCIYLLAQNLDRTAWISVGQLTRLAYACGLDEIDRGTSCVFYQSGITTESDMEEWRQLWWNIWRLDSTANVLNSSPCSTDTYVSGTALCTKSMNLSTYGAIGVNASVTKLFLEGNVSNVWKIISKIFEDATSRDVNLYTASFILLREASSLKRSTRFKPSLESQQQLLGIDRAYAAIRLSLPPWYSNPVQNRATFETRYSHQHRLQALLVLSW